MVQQKVLVELVELVEKADHADGPDDVRVVWRLKSASTNSPFTIRAEATSSDPSVSIAMRAVRAKQVFRQSMDDLLVHGRPAPWMDAPALRTAKRLFERNLNGIGQTDVAFDDEDAPILIVPAVAQKASLSIDKASLEEKLSTANLTRTEYGSLEGEILAAATYYGKPALIMKERLSGDRITCVLSEDLASEIGPEHSWDDIWSGRRVAVSGAIHYNAEGRSTKVDAVSLGNVNEELVDLNDIRAIDITGGISPAEFLNLIRGDDHG